MRKIIVKAVIVYNNGTQELKEFHFDSFNAGRRLISDYIKDNTPECHHVIIIDVWVEV